MINPRIMIVSGDETRHRYFIQTVRSCFSNGKNLIEKNVYPQPPPASGEELEAWRWFFECRDRYEARVFKLPEGPQSGPAEILVSPYRLNSPETLAQMQSLTPDLIVAFGSSLFSKTLIETFPGRIFNLHLGLPEWGRGSSCNFWPIHDKNLAALGATVHRIDAGIDSGEVLARGNIPLGLDDCEQTLLWKTLVLGCDLMVKTITGWQDKTLKPIPQKRLGPLHLKKQFNPQAVLKVKRMVESGELSTLIEDYLAGNSD